MSIRRWKAQSSFQDCGEDEEMMIMMKMMRRWKNKKDKRNTENKNNCQTEAGTQLFLASYT